MGIQNAQTTRAPLSFDPKNLSLLCTWLPRNTLNNTDVVETFKPPNQTGTWQETYIWHPFTTKAEDFIEFSTNPTTY